MSQLAEIEHAWAGEITKFDTNDDGSIMVYGRATGPQVDLDAQVCDPEWLKGAMPDWYKWGNVRAMHVNVAAGVGKELANDEAGNWSLKSHIVDDDTIKKVKAGVYKGYSIGIKHAATIRDPKAPGGRIVKGNIVEVSLVDRPCNPTATIDIAKAFGAVLAPVDTAGVVIAKFGEADDEPPAAVEAAPAPAVEAAPAGDVLTPKAYRAALATVDKVLAASLNKGVANEGADIASARDVIAQIARLIISEASELAAGRLDEMEDIDTLQQAARSMAYFLKCEMRQDGSSTPDAPADPTTYVGLGAKPETTKGTEVDPEKEAPKTEAPPAPEAVEPTPAPEIDKAAGTAANVDLAEIVNKAVAQAVGPLQKALGAAEAKLQQVMDKPIPGGAFIVPPGHHAPAQRSAPDAYSDEKLKFLALAAAAQPGSTLRKGYEDLAAKA